MPLGYTDMLQEIAGDCRQNFIQQYEINQQNVIKINNVHVVIMSSKFILCVALHFYFHPYVHSYSCSGTKK